MRTQDAIKDCEFYKIKTLYYFIGSSLIYSLQILELQLKYICLQNEHLFKHFYLLLY